MKGKNEEWINVISPAAMFSARLSSFSTPTADDNIKFPFLWCSLAFNGGQRWEVARYQRRQDKIVFHFFIVLNLTILLFAFFYSGQIFSLVVSSHGSKIKYSSRLFFCPSLCAFLSNSDCYLPPPPLVCVRFGWINVFGVWKKTSFFAELKNIHSIVILAVNGWCAVLCNLLGCSTN